MNPLLDKIEQGIEAKLKPEDKSSYDRIVLAGTKIMFDQQTHGMMIEILQGSGDLPSKVAGGITRLIGLLYQASKHTMPMQAVIPAAITLMVKALDFAERGMGQQLNAAIIAESAKQTSAAILQQFGVTPEKIQSLLVQNKGAAQPSAIPPTQPAGLISAGPQGI